jgi:hypothetical protein
MGYYLINSEFFLELSLTASLVFYLFVDVTDRSFNTENPFASLCNIYRFKYEVPFLLSYLEYSFFYSISQLFREVYSALFIYSYDNFHSIIDIRWFPLNAFWYNFFSKNLFYCMREGY